jgi:phage tail-like protein
LDPNKPSSSLATWAFFDAYPVKWKISKFNAQQSEIVTESIELTYTYFEYMPSGESLQM